MLHIILSWLASIDRFDQWLLCPRPRGVQKKQVQGPALSDLLRLLLKVEEILIKEMLKNESRGAISLQVGLLHLQEL